MASRLIRPHSTLPSSSSSSSSPTSSDPAKKKKLMVMVGIGVPKDGPGGTDPTANPASSPSSSSAPSPEPDADDSAPPQSMPGAGSASLASPEGQGVPPEAVCYHTGDQHCSACEYMQPDGNCSWLKMPVQPDDWCRLFEAKGGEPDADDLSGGQPGQSPTSNQSLPT